MISGDSFRNESDLWFACTTDEKLGCVGGIVKARQHSENIIDYVNAFDLKLIKENSIVFCKTDYLSYFVSHCSAISVPFNLITGQSDFSITDQMAYDLFQNPTFQKQNQLAIQQALASNNYAGLPNTAS